jgi:hypothetical protein
MGLLGQKLPRRTGKCSLRVNGDQRFAGAECALVRGNNWDVVLPRFGLELPMDMGGNPRFESAIRTSHVDYIADSGKRITSTTSRSLRGGVL